MLSGWFLSKSEMTKIHGFFIGFIGFFRGKTYLPILFWALLRYSLGWWLSLESSFDYVDSLPAAHSRSHQGALCAWGLGFWSGVVHLLFTNLSSAFVDWCGCLSVWLHNWLRWSQMRYLVRWFEIVLICLWPMNHAVVSDRYPCTTIFMSNLVWNSVVSVIQIDSDALNRSASVQKGVVASTREIVLCMEQIMPNHALMWEDLWDFGPAFLKQSEHSGLFVPRILLQSLQF